MFDMWSEFSGNMEIKLTENNFLMYAMKNYSNAQCLDMREFNDDLKRIKYIKRLFSRYRVTGELKERLILNHLIILYNVFGPKAATKMLFYKIDEKFWPQLKTFLVYLSYMPEHIYGVKDHIVLNSDITMDVKIVNILRVL